MSKNRIAATLLAIVSAASVSGALAQGAGVAAAPPGVRDPGDPQAAVPAVRYRSAFERYRANAEVEVGSWRQSNDDVGRIGGWRVYGREAIADGKANDAPAGQRAPGGDSPSKPSNGRPPQAVR